jgi:hypothetical protein
MLIFGSSYVYFVSGGYYELIIDYLPFLVNLAAWVGFALILLVIGACTACICTFSRKLKHSKILFKKWGFYLLEILYFPVLVNIIPFGACLMNTD